MEKKNVLIIVPRLAGGGQERIAALTADILEEFYNVSLIIFSDEKMTYSSNVEIINLNVPSKNGLFSKVFQQIIRIFKLRKIKKYKDAYASYSFGNTANITNILSGKIGKRVISLRGYASIKSSLIDKFVYLKADKITLISEMMKEKLIDIYPYTAKKATVIYNGIDIQKVRELSYINDDSLKLPNTKKIVTAGRLTDVKGHRQLLKSFARLKKQYDDVSLIILGEGENLKILKELVKKLNLDNSVFFLGFQKNLYSLIRQCDVFVLSSINEGFGNVLVEALACEVPIVSTSCLSGPTEILGENNYRIDNVLKARYGMLVPTFISDESSEPSKEKMFADAILNLLTDGDLEEYYINHSFERAEYFSIRNYKKNILSFFEDL